MNFSPCLYPFGAPDRIYRFTVLIRRPVKNQAQPLYGHKAGSKSEMDGNRAIVYFVQGMSKAAYSDEVDRAFRRQGDEDSGMMPIALGAKRR